MLSLAKTVVILCAVTELQVSKYFFGRNLDSKVIRCWGDGGAGGLWILHLDFIAQITLRLHVGCWGAGVHTLFSLFPF